MCDNITTVVNIIISNTIIEISIVIMIKIFLFVVAYFLEKCDRNDPDVNECLIASGNKLIKFLHEGIPELDITEVRANSFPI